MNRIEHAYIPALRYRWLTRAYDAVVGTTTRERRFKTRLVEQARIPEGAEVLDVGCGTGTLALMVKRRVPTVKLTGLDADPDILAIAKRKAARDGLAIVFDQGFSYALPYDADRFDRVLSSLFFHHLDRGGKERTLREVCRVLKPGGELHVGDWGKPSNKLMRALFLSIQLLDGFETTRDNVEGRLPQLMEQAGLRSAEATGEVQTIYGTLTLYRAEKPV